MFPMKCSRCANSGWICENHPDHSRKHNDEVQFYAFDVLALERDDLRPLPLHLRRPTWRGCSSAASTASFSPTSKRAEIGPGLFRHACLMGLEGLVSKLRDRPYRGGRSPHWIKVKNRTHHAFDRVKEAFS